MRKFILITMMAFVSFSAVPVFADSFNDAVEDSRTRVPHKRDDDRPSASRRSSSDDSGCGSCFAALFDQACQTGCDIFLEVFDFLWLESNLNVDYSSFPYENVEDASNYVQYGAGAGTISNRFSVGTSVFLMNDLGVGNETVFEGLLFPVIGPYVENLLFTDPTKFTEELKGNVKAGMQLSLMQTNAISATFLCQFTTWYGNVNYPVKGPGIALGLNVRSFPIKPFILEYKNDWQLYADDVYIFENNLTLGVMLNRFEINAGWKMLLIGNSEEGSITRTWNGATVGTRVWF